MLALGIVACASVCSRRTTFYFTSSVLFALVASVPFIIHQQKAIFSDNPPPFAAFAFVALFMGAAFVMALLLLPLFFAAISHAYYSRGGPPASSGRD